MVILIGVAFLLALVFTIKHSSKAIEAFNVKHRKEFMVLLYVTLAMAFVGVIVSINFALDYINALLKVRFK